MEAKGIIMDMTGDEFKELIERKNPNGRIDTLPEVMQSLQGISDDKEIVDMLAQDGWAEDSDIAELFGQ